MKCERCKKNSAQVRIDQIVNGHREPHYLCQSCVVEIMSSMGQMGSEDLGNDESAPFGFQMNNNAAAAAGAPNTAGTATAQQQVNRSKTPTLDQYGRDLTGEAADGRLDPASGRERELRRVITVLGRRQKNNP
ncbi:MAG TPA: ATP-dependent Clp protease ATP-binding subunit, partial [Ktedonobacteraceae bacterium]